MSVSLYRYLSFCFEVSVSLYRYLSFCFEVSVSLYRYLSFCFEVSVSLYRYLSFCFEVSVFLYLYLLFCIATCCIKSFLDIIFIYFFDLSSNVCIVNLLRHVILQSYLYCFRIFKPSNAFNQLNYNYVEMYQVVFNYSKP